MPSLLCLLPQSPLDTASGAAASERVTCEMLARAGWRVRVLALTATEATSVLPGLEAITRFGISGVRSSRAGDGSPLHDFLHRGVHYSLVDTGPLGVDQARRAAVAATDSLLQQELERALPDLLLTYGSSEAEVRRRARVRQSGTRVIFSVHNLAYTHPRAFESVDAILAPSQYAANFYRQHGNQFITALPQPIDVEDSVPAIAGRTFVTFLNPTPAKGVHIFLRLVRACAVLAPDLPFLAVESRGGAAALACAALAEGCQVPTLENLFVARNTPHPAGVYGVTRVLLVPSLTEAAGRAPVEAQLNGIPVLASDRGGLPETVGRGAIVLPVSDPEIPLDSDSCLAAWVRELLRLHRDEAYYQQWSDAALAATGAYRSGDVERNRVEFFRSQLTAGEGHVNGAHR